MKHVVKKYLIPHKGNNHTPHLLREAGVATLLVVIIGSFLVSFGQTLILKHTDFAAVLSPVLVDLTNADRKTQNLNTLTISPLLSKAAQMKADDMAAKGYFSHTTPEGYSPWYWFDQVGYKFMYAGENLAVNFTESSDVERAWMDSPGHRSNILNEKFTEIGIGTQTGIYQGQSAIFVAQMFGRPMVVQTATVKKPTPVQTKPIAQVPKPVGQVKSESTSTPVTVATTSPEETQVIEAHDMFVAVENISTTSASVGSQIPTAGTTDTVRYASAIERMLSQPRAILMYVYSFISALILLVMGLTIVGEYKRHHMKQVTYGAGLLAVMVILIYTLSSFIPHVIVI